MASTGTPGRHGKEGVDGSGPSEGFANGPQTRPFLGVAFSRDAATPTASDALTEMCLFAGRAWQVDARQRELVQELRRALDIGEEDLAVPLGRSLRTAMIIRPVRPSVQYPYPTPSDRDRGAGLLAVVRVGV